MVRVPRDLDSTLYHCPVADSFGSFIFDWLWVLSVSLQFLFNRWLFLLIAGLKLTNSLTKWQSPLLRIPETNHSFSVYWQDSCLSSEYLITLFPVLSAPLFISISHAQVHSYKVALGVTAPFGRPSASLEFLYSLSFSTRSVQNTTP